VVTITMTPVNDAPVVVGSRAPLHTTDASVVSVETADLFDDVDGDDLRYSATNLPDGLSIDPLTGVISGTVASDASVRGHYGVRVEAEDADGESVGTTIEIDVENVAPVTLASRVAEVEDGERILIGTAGLFDDPDGDRLTYSAQGLPAWLSIDADTGELSGTVPADASTLPAVVIVVTVDDHQGGQTSSEVVIEAMNVAPEIISPIPLQLTNEGQDVLIDVKSHVRDGGNDGDVLEFSANGLPAGLSINAETGIVSGIIETGTAPDSPYSVEVVVIDNQGGRLVVTFEMSVSTPFFDSSEYDYVEVREESRTLVEREEDVDPFVVVAAEKFQNLNPIKQLNGVSGIILDTIQRITSLNNSVSHLDQLTPVTDQVAAIDAINLRGIGEGQFEGTSRQSDAWNVEGLAGFSLNFDLGDREESLSDGDRGGRLLIETFVRNRILYIDIDNTFDPDKEGKVARYKVERADGKPLPDWIRIARDGFVIVERPVDITTLELKISAVLENGDHISRSVSIDAPTGEIQPLKTADDGRKDFHSQIRESLDPNTLTERQLRDLMRS
jgi:hypothetical protein